jgi:AbiV family abortive infection protein
MKAERKAAVSDVINNAERLLADTELLIEHRRFASAFMLAVLAFEEVGKALLWTWGEKEHPAKARSRASFHMRKQSAAGSLLLAGFARGAIEQHLADVGVTIQKRTESTPLDSYEWDDAAVEVLAKGMFESNEGRLTQLIELGAVDKTK